MKNRYNSQETVNDILNASTKLFLEKGYEKTSIQDIVNELDGLTRGAIYHHFDSKDDIVNAVTRRLFLENDIIENLHKRTDLNGAEKLQQLLYQTLFNEEIQKNAVDGYALLKNPRFYVEYMKVNAEVISPEVEKILIEGNSDGSMNVSYPKYIAEVIVLLLAGWYVTEVYPVTIEEFMEKLKSTQYLFNGIGIEVFSEKLLKDLGLDEREK